MAFDSGWSHGDPGDGRLRFDSPKIAKASHVIVNAKDAQDALLDELVPSWRIGDVLVIERPGADRNRVVAWVIGPITHMGPCYRVPILVRSVHGAFAAHDELALHHHRNVTDVDDAPTAPRDVTPALSMRDATTLPGPLAPALLAPIALTQDGSENLANSRALTPVALAAGERGDAGALAGSVTHDSAQRDAKAAAPLAAELDLLRQDNSQLHALLAQLLTDPTTLYAMENDPK